MRHFFLLLAAAAACASSKPPPKSDPAPQVEITPPRRLCSDRTMSGDSFCLNVSRIERLMARDDFRVLERSEPGRHTSDVYIVTVEVPDGDEKVRFRMKWKPCLEGGQGWNNAPRKEVAAYELQKLFLAPSEYVVPPTMLRCLPFERAEKQFGMVDPKPTFPGTQCVLGIASYWLENVTNKNVLHAWRFET